MPVFYGRGQLPGTSTNDSASAGNIGQLTSSSVVSGSAVSLTTNTGADITSISLTAGDWDVTGNILFLPAATTTVSVLQTSVSTTTATRNLNPDALSGVEFSTLVLGNNGLFSVNVPSTRISVASTTTVYLVAFATFGTSTLTAYGYLGARRVR